MPTIVFGEGAGMTGGDHKDTSIEETNDDRSYAGLTDFYTRLDRQRSLIRFSLIGHIPANATINTSVFSAYSTFYNCVNQTVDARNVLTDWGATPINEGAGGDPPLDDSATWRRAFDASATTWAVGAFSAADYGAVEVTTTITALDQWFTWSIPTMTALWAANDATNYGFLLQATGGVGTFNGFASQENAVLARRPFLTVDYTISGISSMLKRKYEELWEE